MILLFCALFALPLGAGELDKPYSPSRKEWLELSLFKVIKDRTDLWKTRIGFVVWVKEEEGKIFITVSSANGEKPPGEEAIRGYLKVIRADVVDFIREYEWSRDLEVHVQYL